MLGLVNINIKKILVPMPPKTTMLSLPLIVMTPIPCFALDTFIGGPVTIVSFSVSSISVEFKYGKPAVRPQVVEPPVIRIFPVLGITIQLCL